MSKLLQDIRRRAELVRREAERARQMRGRDPHEQQTEGETPPETEDLFSQESDAVVRGSPIGESSSSAISSPTSSSTAASRACRAKPRC